ncbi:AimR family lysis-lysogeny pheromone receptor [Halobacillus mangrovi]|uniref:AimR family lysis-lysogeny pheromone receptor n=1 Tax=Halobacillus mangrovi TaxID=402384 RepID=UPI003D97921E
MKNHSVLEPQSVHKLQFTYSSDLYTLFKKLLETYPHEVATDKVRDYCMSEWTLKLEGEIARMEFLYTNDYLEDIKTLIYSGQLHPDVSFLYNFLIKRAEYEVTKQDVERLESMAFDHPTLRCLSLFTLIYYNYDVRKYGVLDKYIEACDRGLQSINEPLTYYYFKLRYNELLFNHYWKTDNTLLARRYAYKIVNTELSPKKSVMIHHNLALTYVYEDYEASMEQALFALHLAEENNIKSQVKSLSQRTIPFIASFHERAGHMRTPDKVETAHLAIARKEFLKAREILESLESLTPFQECYLGLATKDRDLIKHSKQRFIHEYGDLFFARLPDYYLERV